MDSAIKHETYLKIVNTDIIAHFWHACWLYLPKIKKIYVQKIITPVLYVTICNVKLRPTYAGGSFNYLLRRWR